MDIDQARNEYEGLPLGEIFTKAMRAHEFDPPAVRQAAREELQNMLEERGMPSSMLRQMRKQIELLKDRTPVRCPRCGNIRVIGIPGTRCAAIKMVNGLKVECGGQYKEVK